MLDIKSIESNFPYLTCITCRETDFVCIVQNHDEKILTYYDVGRITDADELKEFLRLGDIWWFESNRKLPINIFVGVEMKRFQYCLTTVPMKDVVHVFGPMTSLNNLLIKRIKRRQIQLIRKP